MTVQAGKAAARSYFDEVLNHGNMVVADAIFTAYITAVREAFPDIMFAVEDLFGEGDRVAARWSLAGTQTGSFRGKPGTGKRVAVSGNTVFRLQGGKIAEMWVAFDPAKLA